MLHKSHVDEPYSSWLITICLLFPIGVQPRSKINLQSPRILQLSMPNESSKGRTNSKITLYCWHDN